MTAKKVQLVREKSMTRAQDDAAAEQRNRVAHEVTAEKEMSLQERDADAFADAKKPIGFNDRIGTVRHVRGMNANDDRKCGAVGPMTFVSDRRERAAALFHRKNAADEADDAEEMRKTQNVRPRREK
jgi:hypothetical protein